MNKGISKTLHVRKTDAININKSKLKKKDLLTNIGRDSTYFETFDNFFRNLLGTKKSILKLILFYIINLI